MRFVETPVLTRDVCELLSDDDYHALQVALMLRPEAGSLLRGTGGLRKIRWAAAGRGKRGSFRFIYYWHKPSDLIYMLLIYSKNRQEDLTPKEAKALRKLVREEFK
jgi:mRNA-degrading endonuclease RelE of RelBE toxin-antitoxin system